PDGVDTYTVTAVRSFFKAYEYINPETTFDATMHFDDELFTEEQIELVLNKCGGIGLGAFRARFGKFVWV
ncbi:MAG: hypothetical protein GY931_11540, partial [Maribacter sp.]|nr:hypothetical protein [Maribacter sp.]